MADFNNLRACKLALLFHGRV